MIEILLKAVNNCNLCVYDSGLADGWYYADYSGAPHCLVFTLWSAGHSQLLLSWDLALKWVTCDNWSLQHLSDVHLSWQ